MDQSLTGAGVSLSVSTFQCTPDLLLSTRRQAPVLMRLPTAHWEVSRIQPLLGKGCFPVGAHGGLAITHRLRAGAAMELLPALCGLLPGVPALRDIFQTETLPAIKGPRHRIRQGVRGSVPYVTSQDSFPQAP